MKRYPLCTFTLAAVVSMNLHSHIVCKPSEALRIPLGESQPIQSASTFVKAASGVVFADGALYIVQDSSRYLAKADPAGKQPVEFFALAPQEVIAELEDPSQPYEFYRKERKADFESITGLKDGRLLILGSGYDAQKIHTGKAHYKNIAVIFDPKTKRFEQKSLSRFYHHLLNRSDFVGQVHQGIAPRLNIEGVAVVGNEIAFFHRANYNKNQHDAVIFYNLEEWMNHVNKNEPWSLEESGLVTFDFGSVDAKGQSFPITLNDAILWKGDLIIPVASETDSIVDGRDIDGEVIWMGLARVNLATKSCQMYRLDESKTAKIEGIAFVPGTGAEFLTVHDVDSEEHASHMSRLFLSDKEEL